MIQLFNSIIITIKLVKNLILSKVKVNLNDNDI